MNVLSWILFGLLVGLTTTVVDRFPTRRKFFSSLLFGIVGALLGGIGALFLFDTTLNGFNLLAFVVAAITSYIFLFFGKRMQRS